MLKALITDIDGTITNSSRRIDTGAVETIRSLADDGIRVVLASGNTACFMDALCKMVGTDGTFIAENGGVYRIGYTGSLHIRGSQEISRRALETVQAYYRDKGIELELFNPTYRFSDLAFARTVPAEEVKTILADQPVQVLDTGYAIHLQEAGISKGGTLPDLAQDMGLTPKDFFAIGDGMNDTGMLKIAGRGVTVANAHPDTKAAASDVMDESYGKGFTQAVKKYLPYFRAR
ncbi:MAG: phosphoglycolate phosphatase [Methanoregula sp.]|nr:phosphoglycolate phosphatase [Methanoregula sp.]